jgi:hypothetical protein
MKGRIMDYEEYGVLKIWMVYAGITRIRGETQANMIKRVVATVSTDRQDAQRLVNEHAGLAEKGVQYDYEWVVAPTQLTPEVPALSVRVAKA